MPIIILKDLPKRPKGRPSAAEAALYRAQKGQLDHDIHQHHLAGNTVLLEDASGQRRLAPPPSTPPTAAPPPLMAPPPLPPPAATPSGPGPVPLPVELSKRAPGRPTIAAAAQYQAIQQQLVQGLQGAQGGAVAAQAAAATMSTTSMSATQSGPSPAQAALQAAAQSGPSTAQQALPAQNIPPNGVPATSRSGLHIGPKAARVAPLPPLAEYRQALQDGYYKVAALAILRHLRAKQVKNNYINLV